MTLQSPVAEQPATGPYNQSLLNEEWQAARRAYQRGKPEATAEYRRLVEKYPDVIDLRGELGNILYANGLMKEAAEQYYEVALRHLQGPQPQLAACLVPTIKQIDQQRGEELESRITRSCPYKPPG